MPSTDTESTTTGGDREPLSGLVQRVTFHNPDTGFVVLRADVRGHREPVTVVGVVATVSPGEWIQASGHWERSREHGPQFRARLLETTPPSTVEGIERYLGSGLIPGIGPTYAKRLVKAFGEAVFDVIENEPKRLRHVAGIGPLRASRITEGWAEQRSLREIMVFLQSHGVSTSRAVRIYRTYGADAVPLITADPYRLARDLRGIGFQTADQIAAQLGLPKDSPVRARAGLAWVLGEAVTQGHCAQPRDDLLENAGTMLDIEKELLVLALDTAIDMGELVAESIDGVPCVLLPQLHHAETTIAERLRSLSGGAPPWAAIDPDLAVPWAESRLGLALAPSQREALETALRSKVCAITGGPGVGKTTLVRTLLEILRAKGAKVLLCAPTGRAAKRLQESTGLEARTIHRLLGAGRGGFRHDAAEPLQCDLLVIDEASMVDVSLAASLLRAVPDGAATLWIGDIDQLPSVGPGRVLGDILDAGVPQARLVEVFRQARHSRIVTNAHRINRGLMPETNAGEDPSDFYFVPIADPQDGADKVLRLVSRRIPQRFGLDPLRDIQVLTPMNRGELGTRTLNQRLQETLNPYGTAVERFGTLFRVGDRVMQTENDYDKDVFNGDLGRIAELDLEEQQATLRFEGRSVAYGFNELDQVQLAYATTIHKSQGSEYEAVVLPISTQHYPMLQRNLLYTGITRARRLVVLVGQTRAIEIAVRNADPQRRLTRLRQLLIGGAAGA